MRVSICTVYGIGCMMPSVLYMFFKWRMAWVHRRKMCLPYYYSNIFCKQQSWILPFAYARIFLMWLHLFFPWKEIKSIRFVKYFSIYLLYKTTCRMSMSFIVCILRNNGLSRRLLLRSSSFNISMETFIQVVWRMCKPSDKYAIIVILLWICYRKPTYLGTYVYVNVEFTIKNSMILFTIL